MKRYFALFLVVTLALLGLLFSINTFSVKDLLGAVAVGGAVSGGLLLLNRVVFRRYPKARKYLIFGVIGLLLLILLCFGWLGIKPLGVKKLVSSPNPATSYEEAVARIEALQAEEDESYNPLCRSQFMTHGQKTVRAIVLLHGLANCPEQFRPLGEIFYQLGYNVLIPRAPHHGKADRMTADLANLTAEELTAYGGEAADILQGLGDEKTVVGFSMGGVVASWLAQNRSDVDRVVLIAPALGLRVIPAGLTNAAANLYLAMPNIFVWWNPLVKMDHLAEHGYPGFASRALGQLMRLSAATRQQAAHSPPGVEDILVVANESDFAVNKALIAKLVDQWRSQGVKVETYTFPLEQLLPHDLIDAKAMEERVEEVYPVLIDLIEN